MKKQGTIDLQVKQVGLEKMDQVPLHTYSEAARLDGFKLYAGDHEGILQGTRLDEVASVTVNSVNFLTGQQRSPTPGVRTPWCCRRRTPLVQVFTREEHVTAKVTLKGWPYAGPGVDRADPATERKAFE